MSENLSKKQANTTLGSRLSHEDIVITLAIGIGFIGGVIIFCLKLPPIIVAIFLATGIASLVYGFLGGIQEATFNLGPIKLVGSIAALLGCTWFINSYLEKQMTPPPIENYSLGHSDRRFTVFSEAKPDSTLGYINAENLKDIRLFNSIKNLRGFIVTDRLPPGTRNIDLDPIPFRLSTRTYGNEYSRYILSDKTDSVVHNGCIMRKQAEIVEINGGYYLVAVVEVNHNPVEGEKPYAKFAAGEIIVDIAP
jgi:hypothetical protein